MKQEIYENKGTWGFDVSYSFRGYSRKRDAQLGLTRYLYGKHTKGEWQQMKNFFKNTCVKCENRHGYINIEMDHIVPICDGGTDLITNLQPLCAKCNNSKSLDSTDYRIMYCKKHGLEMPNNWTL